MPRYFFNVFDPVMSRDELGTECPDLRAARAEAVRTSGQMLQGIAEGIRDGLEWRMEVTDHREHVLFVVRVAVEDGVMPGRGAVGASPDQLRTPRPDCGT
jgi:hypothetical protein